MPLLPARQHRLVIVVDIPGIPEMMAASIQQHAFDGLCERLKAAIASAKLRLLVTLNILILAF